MAERAEPPASRHPTTLADVAGVTPSSGQPPPSADATTIGRRDGVHLSSALSPTCFICQHDTRRCATACLDGTLLSVSAPASSSAPGALTLELDDGQPVSVALNDHARPLARALASNPHTNGLRMRVYHLWRGPLAGKGGPDYAMAPLSVIALEPDLLLNITDINNAEYCARQYPLRRMVPSAPTAASLKGTVIHQAFKEMLKAGGAATTEPLAQALRAQATDLALRQISAETLAADAQPHLDALAQWYGSQRASLWTAAPDIRAETFLLAPEVGLKGRLDLFMRGPGGDALLELKTGQARRDLPRREHRWQVYGYETLLTVRQPPEGAKPAATLLYSGTAGQAEGYTIPFTARDLGRVLELRNELALIHATGVVPAPPGGNKCGRCALRDACSRASALLGWEAPPGEAVEGDPRKDEPTSAPTRPSEDDATWFRELYEMLRLEARAAERESAALWRFTPAERCAAGVALGGLEPLGEPRQTTSGEWEYTFRCENRSELREGDAILLSDGDPISGAIVTGSILRLTDDSVTVWTPERIERPSLIDRYGSDIVHDRTVRNLWRWLEVTPRMRALVAGERAPQFDPEPDLVDLPDDFNEEQRAAVARALGARDFALVQGPPGAGKTTVVAEIVGRAVAAGKRVLLAAFTNQAVDNALARVLARGPIEVVRLGHELSVAPEVADRRLAERARQVALAAGQTEAADAAWRATPEALRAALLGAQVVAATTATWSAERFDDAGAPLQFDLAVIDEASQLTIPAILGALRFAPTFTLVGDERQLPPLVMSEQASRTGLGDSLFGRLLERWGELASVALRRQYRMHPDICGFPSQEFYGGALFADGPARTATLRLRLDPTDPLAPALDPLRALVWVDVPEPGSQGKVSETQALFTRRIAQTLVSGGVAPERIGVIAPFRAQVAALRRRLRAADLGAVMVDTVDRFQGAEREVIIYSFGGASHIADLRGRGLDFLADRRRLNVALTRAQRKLIILGDRQALERSPLLRQLVAYCAGLYGGRGGTFTWRRTERTGV